MAARLRSLEAGRGSFMRVTLLTSLALGCVLAAGATATAQDGLDTPSLQPIVSLTAQKPGEWAARFSIDRAGHMIVDATGMPSVRGPNRVEGTLTKDEQTKLMDLLAKASAASQGLPEKLTDDTAPHNMTVDATLGDRKVSFTLGGVVPGPNEAAYKALNDLTKALAVTGRDVALRDPRVQQWLRTHDRASSIVGDGPEDKPAPAPFTPKAGQLYHWDYPTGRWAEGTGMVAGPIMLEKSSLTPALQTAAENGWAKIDEQQDGWVVWTPLDPQSGKPLPGADAGAPRTQPPTTAPAPTVGLAGKTDTQITQPIR